MQPIRRWTALSATVLLLATSRLWLPAYAHAFPQIPLFEPLCFVPLWIDWLLLSGLIAGLMLLLLPDGRYTASACHLVFWCGIGMVALSQQRLQPWFYQLLIFCLVFQLRDERRRLRLLQAFVISIYFFSAVGKLDFEFLHTVAQQFLRPTLLLIGENIDGWAWSTRVAAAMLFPAIELLLAGGLLWSVFQPRSKFGVAIGIAVCLFHVALMALLAVGLQHSAGVVVWNFQFAVQALLMFAFPPRNAIASHALSEPDKTLTEKPMSRMKFSAGRWTSHLIAGLVVIAMGMPLVERVGLWDHWMSWALYAPHSSRVELFVAQNAVSKLPSDLQQLVEVHEDVLWARVPLAKWSLQSLGTPIYPQARFELGVSREVAEWVDSEFAIRAVVLGTASRFDGRRTHHELLGKSRLERAAASFLFNTRPRQLLTLKQNEPEQ